MPRVQFLRQSLILLCVLGSAAAYAAGDPAAGAQINAACKACHGADGKGLVPSYPGLGGQNERYLFRQLELIQSGARSAPLMAGQLNAMTETNLRDLAAYYASQPASAGQAAGNDEQIARANGLFRGGSLSKNVAACTGCHSPNGSGNAPAGFPRLAGQSAEYVVAQLTAYREGVRTTDEEYGGMMRQVAGNLNDGDIAALADFLQGLH